MNLTRLTPGWIAASLCVACTATTESPEQLGDREVRVFEPVATPVSVVPTVRVPMLSAPAQDEVVHIDPSELQLWNSPSWQKAFIESHISETEIEPTVDFDDIEALEKIQDYMAADELDKAEKLCERNRGPADSALFDMFVAQVHLRRERLEEAITALEVATGKFPKFRRAWEVLGWTFFRSNQIDRAIPAFTRVIELGGTKGITYGMLGYAYFSAGDPLAAETAYRMAVLMDPSNEEWKRGLAFCLFQQQRYPEAAALFETLIQRDQENADLWLAQANAFIGMGKAEQAAVNYEMVEMLGGSTIGSLNNLADIYTNGGQTGAAARFYLRALEEDPTKGLDRALRAAGDLIRRSAYDEATLLLEGIETLCAAAVEGERRTDFLRLQARIAVQSGGGEEQVAVLEEIIALDPLDGQAINLLGDHYRSVGKIEEAIFRYERAAKIEGYEYEAKRKHGQLLVSEGRYAEALPLLRGALELKESEFLRSYVEQVEARVKR